MHKIIQKSCKNCLVEHNAMCDLYNSIECKDSDLSKWEPIRLDQIESKQNKVKKDSV